MIQWNEWIGVVLHMRVHSAVAKEDCTEHSWLLCIWMRNDPRKLSSSSLLKETHTMSAGVCHPSLKTLWQILNHQILEFWIFHDLPISTICAILCHVDQEQQLTGTRRGRLLYQGLEHWNGYGRYGPKWSTLQNGWFSIRIREYIEKYLRIFETSSLLGPLEHWYIDCDPSPWNTEAAAAVLGDAALAKTQKICVNAGGWQVEGETQTPEVTAIRNYTLKLSPHQRGWITCRTSNIGRNM